MTEAIITDKAMQAAPTTRDRWLIEAGARGAGRLVGRITSAGERRFYYRYTDSSGQRVRLPIGVYDPRGDGVTTFTVLQARNKARDWAALHRSGVRNLREYFLQLKEDSQQAEIDARLAATLERQATLEREQLAQIERARRMTLHQLFERWRAVDLQPHVQADGKRAGRKDGGKFTSDNFERYVFPALAQRPVEEVRKADLMAILDGVKAAGKLRTANVLLSDMKQMFAFALMRDIIERNPLDTVTRRHAGGPNALRERVLSPIEITRLAVQIPQARLHPRSATAIWLLLATGARIGELMGAVWTGPGVDLKTLAQRPEAQDVKVGLIDTVAATWYLPTTKNEREHTIHLSAFAIEQFDKLAGLRELDTNGRLIPWVFPNALGTGPVCVKSFGKQLADRQRPADQRMSRRSTKTEALALPGGKWTAHDLRRTAGTLMASLGISGDVIDECLNHVIESRVRRTYIRDRRPQEQAQAFDALGSRLQFLIAG